MALLPLPPAGLEEIGRGEDDTGDEGGWNEDDLEEALWLLDDRLPQWVDGALAHGRDLLLLRDGGR
ncbi:hypothetical protein ACIRRH_32810 [Kitasatospora sp. NPDC101235]|uniref:hypothetical protein n=1 Tax=Kitasatospora sp. NPDC101235 TaxID=3364101 RepID=UPI003825C20C